MKQILIGGVGSILLGDDAVGPYAARWIAANYEFEDGSRNGVRVEVEDLGTPGLDLIAYVSAVDVLILIDSVANRLPPGSITVFDRKAITAHRPAVRLDPHAPCITESIYLAEMAGSAPPELFLVGVTPESLEVGTQLSQPVRNAIPMVVERVLELVALHGGSYRQRETPADPAIWWEPAASPRFC